MEIDCPKCEITIDVTDLVPNNACDDEDIQCENCGHEITIGWYAEAEIRDDKLSEAQEKVN